MENLVGSRKTNKKIVDDLVPNFTDIDKLGRWDYFTNLDLENSFQQIEMELDVSKTAFNNCLYIENILIYSVSLQKYSFHSEKVFERLRKTNFKI